MSAEIRNLLETYVAAYNDGRLDDLRTCVAPGYQHHSGEQTLSIDDFCAGATWVRRGLPDLRLTVEDLVLDGDRAAMRFVVAGVHDGAFGDETPTGRAVVVHGITMLRFVDGLIAEDWEALDEAPLRALLVG